VHTFTFRAPRKGRYLVVVAEPRSGVTAVATVTVR
jgi:hypothetical protein